MLQPSVVARTFAVVAVLEACTWAGLLVGMVLKHVTGTTDVGVQVFGALHGGAFLVYVAVAIVAAVRLRWSPVVAALALAASLPPLATVVFERWARSHGWLRDPADRRTARRAVLTG